MVVSCALRLVRQVHTTPQQDKLRLIIHTFRTVKQLALTTEEQLKNDSALASAGCILSGDAGTLIYWLGSSRQLDRQTAEYMPQGSQRGVYHEFSGRRRLT